MEETPESVKVREEIFSSILEIFNHVERLIDYLVRKRKEEAILLGVLVAILVWFFGIIAVVIVNFLTGMYATKYFIEHQGSSLVYFGFLLALSLPLGCTSYFYAKQRYTKEYIPWKNSLSRLKTRVDENEAGEAGIIEVTLQLIDQANTWFLDVLKYKSEEALVYGLIAFLLTAFISANSPIGVPVSSLIGVVVWLYFRYEKKKESVQQIQTFKALRRKFEEGKDHFLQSI